MTRDRKNASWSILHMWLLLIGVLAVMWLSACSPQPLTVTREPVTLRIAAAEACGPLVESATSAYKTLRPWVTVEAEVLNNDLAIEALLEERADVALLSQDSMDEEAREALWTESFAYDGIAVIVHPGSPFSAIGMSQLRDIFEGRMQEWQGVVLTVVSREAGSGTRAAFERLVLDEGETSLNAVVVPSGEAMMDYVESTSTAIGYVSTLSLDDRVRALPIEGAAPTDAALVDGRYPFRRELVLATHGEPVGEARQFTQWLLRIGAAEEWKEWLAAP